MKPVVIFGAGGFAELVHYYVTHDAGRIVAAFTVDREYLKETSFCGLPVVPFDAVETHFPPAAHDMLICVGYSNLLPARAVAPLRKTRFMDAKRKGYALTRYVSSRTALWPNNRVGSNAIIMEQNAIQPFVRIGDNAVVFGGCTLGHHTEVADHCFLSPGVTVAGFARIGEGSFLGTGAVVGPYVSVGEYAVISAGTTLIK